MTKTLRASRLIALLPAASIKADLLALMRVMWTGAGQETTQVRVSVPPPKR